MSVIRFGVSLDEDLLKALDEYVQDNRFASRSQAIRQLIERNLVEQKWLCGNIVAGAVVLVYGNEKSEVNRKFSEIIFENRDVVLSSQRFILNEQNSLEIIAVKGPSKRLTGLADQLIAVKGIQHGKLIMSKAE